MFAVNLLSQAYRSLARLPVWYRGGSAHEYEYLESHERTRRKDTHIPIISWYPFSLVVVAGIELAECGHVSRVTKSTEDRMGSEA